MRNTPTLKHLSLTLAVILYGAAFAGPSYAATIPVTSCDDSAGAGTSMGTLRFAVNTAVDGDTVDLSTTPCSTITLQSGELATHAKGLTISASAAHRVSIDANYNSRVVEHIGSGALALTYLTLEHGRYYGTRGGCINSTGSVVLIESTVAHCEVRATPTGLGANGGGVYANEGLSMIRSTITGSSAAASSTATGSQVARGGGAFVGSGGTSRATAATFTMKYSTLEGNYTVHAPNDPLEGEGGGAYVFGANVTILNSTLSGNVASSGGGIHILSGPIVFGTVNIANSTVSGNLVPDNANGRAGGISVGSNIVNINNSTIAYNFGNIGGIEVGGPTVTMQSNIIAKNVSSFASLGQDMVVAGTSTMVSGANNAIMSLGSTNVPANFVVSNADPLMTPLSNHGGNTKTHALRATSSVLGLGNNTANHTTDQRGVGFPRPSVAPDVGAYERQPLDDELFYAPFEP